jgi:orotate phosphoribosyltransferase
MDHSHTTSRDLVSILRRSGAVLVGDYELKNGRRSPYFIDFGTIPDGETLSALGACFADKIANDFDLNSFDLVFGPAYKGIPIAVATVIALATRFGVNKQYAFDRKVEKTYGERSRFIGGQLDGAHVLMIDDVITDGGTKIETIEALQSAGATVVGIVVGVDRTDHPGVIREFERRTDLTVQALCTVDDIDAHIRDVSLVA